MTVYDEPPASDGKGGPHPLAGIPQGALDAATRELTRSLEDRYLPQDEIESIAHAVLASAITAGLPTGITLAQRVRQAILDPGAFTKRRREGEYERLDQWQERAMNIALNGEKSGD